MAGESRHERPVRRGRVDDTGGDAEGGKLYYHLTLLAETNAGYANLLKLSSAAFLEGYYYKPRVDWELLERYHEGLIATSGCLGGVVLQSLLAGDDEGALEKAARLQDIFGRDGFFIELQDHGLDEQRTTNPKLVEIATLARRAAARDERQPLHAPRGRDRARRAPVRADRRAARRREAVPVRGHRALPEVRRRDAPPVPRRRGGVRQHAARSPSARASRSSSAARRCPSSRCPRASRVRPTRTRAAAYLRELTYEGAARRYGDAGARRRARAARLRARRHRRTWASRRTSSSCGTSSATRARTGSASGRVAGRPRRAASRTASTSSTSTHCATTSCSSGS